MVNPKYQEILKLHAMLLDKDIPHDIERSLDGWRISYPSSGLNRVFSIVENRLSCGSIDDLIELGFCNTLIGDLTAEDVFNRIKKHYEEAKNEHHIYEKETF